LQVESIQKREKKVTTRENKAGLRSEKLAEVVKTAYGPNGELQVVAENVNL